MFIVRPVAMEDLDQLAELASLAGPGLTTLPDDRKFLRKRIRSSQIGFENLIEKPDAPAGEIYLFVMEDVERKKLIGTSAIFSKVGGFEPFYSYRIEREIFESQQINIHKEVPILKLHEEHNGPTELGSLFIHPDYRKGGNGRVLSLVRFLFAAEHPNLFEPVFIAEIRGVSDAAGNSPFWDAIGRHFFGIDFPQADYLSALNKKFIAELMPDHPIYITMLPQAAQEVIGVPHEQSRGAVKTLEDEGFDFDNVVDIFDAGPLLSCKRENIRTVTASRRARVKIGDAVESEPFLICTTGTRFLACAGKLHESNGEAILTSESSKLLGVNGGDTIRYVPLRSKIA